MSLSERPLDRRNPLVLGTHDLGRRAGAMREIHTDVPAPDGMAVDVIGVPPSSSIALDLRLESVVDGVLVSGTATVTVTGECGRCLDPIEHDLVIDVQELYLHPGIDPDDDEASRIADELIDLEPLIRDEVVLELPFMPLCREDCTGLCPTCGANLNADPDHSHGPVIDPRWGELTDWRDQQNN